MRTWQFDGWPGDDSLAEIATSIVAGGVFLLPTDTIYGLHARWGDRDAAARISAMKGRDERKQYLLLAASVEQLEHLGVVVPTALRELWPAPLTAVLQLGDQTVAARVPAVGWLRSLIARTGPLLSTSANRSGETPITRPSLFADELREAIDGVLDIGTLEGQPSTIIDLTGDEPKLIREGALRFTQNLRKTLRKCL